MVCIIFFLISVRSFFFFTYFSGIGCSSCSLRKLIYLKSMLACWPALPSLRTPIVHCISVFWGLLITSPIMIPHLLYSYNDLVIKIRPTGMLILKWGPYQLPNTPLHTAMSFKHWYQGSAILLAYWYNVSWQLILFLEVFPLPTSDLLAWFGNTCPFLKIRCRKKTLTEASFYIRLLISYV